MAVMVRKRPVFLNLLQIRLPVAGVMSIVHRAAGVVLFLGTPLLVYLFQHSLSAVAGFSQVVALFNEPLSQLLLLLGCWALMHHLLAGIRYLLIDIEVGIDAPQFRYSAWAVLLFSPVLALLLLWRWL